MSGDVSASLGQPVGISAVMLVVVRLYKFYASHYWVATLVLVLVLLRPFLVFIFIDLALDLCRFSKTWWYVDWYTSDFRRLVYWNLLSIAAWHVSMTIIRIFRFCVLVLKAAMHLCRKTTVLDRLSASFARTGQRVAVWWTPSGKELWLHRDDEPVIAADFIVNDPSAGHWERVCSDVRGRQTASNWQDTPPTSRHPTPQEFHMD